MPIAQHLPGAVPSPLIIGWPGWAALARESDPDGPVDVAFAMLDDPGDPSEGLEFLQLPLADPVDQFSVGIVERDLVLH